MTTAEQLSGKQNPGPTWKRGPGAHHKTPEQRVDAARKGGLTVSRNKAHMATIGRKGALAAASRDPGHMKRISVLGQAALLAKYGPDYFRELSRKAREAREKRKAQS